MEILPNINNYGKDVSFPTDWKILPLKDLFSFFSTATFSRNDLNDSSETLYIHYGDVHTKFNYHLDLNKVNLPRISDEKVKKYELLKEGDLIIVDASEDYNGIGKAIEIINVRPRKVISGLHTFMLRDKNGYFSPKFKGYCMLSSFAREQFYRFATGTKVYSISKDVLGNIRIPIPPLREQKTIAHCLAIWDNAIELQSKLINRKEEREKALMQQLLTGKLRLKGFENDKGTHFTKLGLQIPCDWKIIKIKDVFEERKESSNDQLKFPLFSLTIEKGITDKTDRYERSFLLRNKESNLYKLVYPKDIVFNPMNLRFGSIAKSNLNIIVSVSAYYNSLKVKTTNINIDYYEALFKMPVFINFYDRIAIGSLNEKKRVHLSNLLELEIPYLSFEEQNAIMNILKTSRKEIQLEKKKLTDLQEQKKGLMQQLLTGKIRLL
jgi:type I restriction enzyme S subunit